jgi:hypothetical protein
MNELNKSNRKYKKLKKKPHLHPHLLKEKHLHLLKEKQHQLKRHQQKLQRLKRIPKVKINLLRRHIKKKKRNQN